MKENLTAKASIGIVTSHSEVWEALTDLKLVKQYLFGTEVTSGWKGDPITWE